MIKLIIFDLDGTLVETKRVHFEALNMALREHGEQYVISEADHIARFDGKSTWAKLDILREERALRRSVAEKIFNRKQQITNEVLRREIKPNQHIRALFSQLRRTGYKLAVASNAIENTVFSIIDAMDLSNLVDFIIGNDTLKHPKPNPEIYYHCMINFGISAKETLIIEDSYVGRRAAYESGAHLLGVNGPNDLLLDTIMQKIQSIECGGSSRPRWSDSNLNVLIPMAGAGSRFAEAGYTFPKPLIEVAGKPMIHMVVDTLSIDAHYIYIVQREHAETYNMRAMLNLITPGCDVVEIDGMTEGAACTILKAEHLIDNDKQLLISNCDQYIEWDSSAFMYAMQSERVDGGIPVFHNTHPKWSYAKIDESGRVVEVAEKVPISTHSTTGHYYYKRGSDFVKYAKQMIAADRRVLGEFYVCPVVNEAIVDGKNFRIWPVDKMYGTGTPEDLQEFLRVCPWR